MKNRWWEIQVLCDRALEDTVSWRLGELGCRGTASQMKDTSCVIYAYLLQQQAPDLDLSALSTTLNQDAAGLGVPAPFFLQQNLIDEEDWASSWKSHWQPQPIGDRLLIHPAWLPEPETCDRQLLRLEPGVAFGTGDHATTQLCLESLEMRLASLQPGVTIADIGCGSGILSVAALLLGASQVYAVDTDPLAVQATRENITLNQLDPDRLWVAEGSISALKTLTEAPVDGLVCNILAEVIIELIPQWQPWLKPTTWGILSGILVEQADRVTDALEKNGWFVATLWKRQEWCCLNIRRS